jgi:CTP synthase (UTP-ammonia lyase)
MKKIGIIGDFNTSYYTHLAINDAISHISEAVEYEFSCDWVHTSILKDNFTEIINRYNGIWMAPGTPYANMQGALDVIKYARENDIPLFAICGGFQHMIIEYARNSLGIKNAEHEETSPDAENLIIKSLPCSLLGQTEELTITDKDSITYRAIGKDKFIGNYHCSFGLNPEFKKIINDGGLNVVVENDNGEVRGCELKSLKFFVGSLFQPQLQSKTGNPNPLLLSFFKSATY